MCLHKHECTLKNKSTTTEWYNKLQHSKIAQCREWERSLPRQRITAVLLQQYVLGFAVYKTEGVSGYDKF